MLAASAVGAATDRAINNLLYPLNILSSWGGVDDYCRWRGGGLSGSISPDIGNLTYLRFLDLSRNHLQGQVQPELGNLLHLESLRLGSNSLTGEIPAETGALRKLVILSLHDNNLTGRIPPSLGNLSSLTLREID
ncbi:hypothetical protein OPV22_019086 [Ensete ventricosum]|uniref:Disease resistance R13L4/SHOC-2-like LRR domain-containing protein n=1 Tax=Ensete ventricosum TaxID=4639 RepID=A0AAV8QX26_ENSVE|nr:hypothetical protein OPV22_019086 [Ensete ventricosum]